MINLNQVVAYSVKKQSNTEYRVSAYKKYPDFVELEAQIFETSQETWEDDPDIVLYFNNLQTKYAYPY